MFEYRDIMAQLKYPGVSKCMSEIYESSNMDDIQYSADLSADDRERPYENDITR